MAHFLLIYDLADDYLERRGALILGGALADPADQAILLFDGDSAAAAEAFAKSDPYVAHGLIKSWRVRPWTTVVGALAANPVRP